MFKKNKRINLLLLVFIIIINKINKIKTANLYPANALSIVEGEGFLFYLITVEPFNILKKCHLTFKGEIYDLNPNNKNDNNITYITDLNEKITHYSNKECGARITNINKLSNGKLLIEGEDNYGYKQSGLLQLDILYNKTYPTIYNLLIKSNDKTIKINCPYDNDKRYCRIINNLNDIYDEQCDLTININGKFKWFKCYVYSWGKMNYYEYTYNIQIEEENDIIKKQIIDTNDKIQLICINNNDDKTNLLIKKCYAELPYNNNEQILIMDGLLNDKYSAYNTRLSAGICSLEINKPLTILQQGIWRIYLDIGSTLTGCIYNLSINNRNNNNINNHNNIIKNNTKYINNNNDIVKNQLIDTELIEIDNINDELIIECNINNIINLCYLISPNGTIYNINELIFNKQRYIGKCKFTNLFKESGKWLCYIITNNNINNNNNVFIKEINVNIYNKTYGNVITKYPVGHIGDECLLLCKTIKNQLIKNCLFIDPNNNLYLMHDKNSTIDNDNNFEYYGNGLINGDCGIRIKYLTNEHFGMWSCNFQLNDINYNPIHKLNIFVEKKKIKPATIIGLTFGIGFIIFGILFLYGKKCINLWKYQRRHHRNEHSVSANIIDDNIST